MDDWIEINSDDKHIKKERAKARELRKSTWFQNELARGVCHFCGGRFTMEELTMEHLVPLSRGGKSTKGNVVIACKECNSAKKYLTPAEMVMRRCVQDDEDDKG